MKTPPRPPRLPERIFRWYSASAQVEDLLGDLEEIYQQHLTCMPVRKARRLYWRNALVLLFSYAVKRRKQHAAHHPLSSNAYPFIMLKSYFTIAARSLAQQRFFTILNVAGLAIGMSISLLFIAMLTYVSGYDTFHARRDGIYRVTTQVLDGDNNRTYASAPAPLAEKLQHECAAAGTIVRIQNRLTSNARYKENEVPLAGYFADPTFLQVFTFPLLKGNPATALQKLNSLLITEKAAHKLFRDEDPLGKIITLKEYGDFEITGVLKDHPKNSHMQFEVITSYETLLAWQKVHPQPITDAWQDFRGNYIYFLLADHAPSTDVEAYLQKATPSIYTQPDKFQAVFHLQALNDIVPGPEHFNEIGPEWGYASLYIFGALCLLILLPACFNYTNLSISRALKRAREIGLRKAMGGQRAQIFQQFITETVLIALLALIGAFGLFLLMRQEFLSMLVSSDALELNADLPTILCFLIFATSVGFVAGILPAAYFSRLNPVQALRNTIPHGAWGSMWIQKCLMVFQFALSLGFIMSVAIVLKQYRSSLTFDFGFDKANIVDVNLQGVDPQRFRNEFLKLSAVQTISLSSNVLGTSYPEETWVKQPDQADSTQVFAMSIDQHYLGNLGLTLVAGENFGDAPGEQAHHILVNEEFLRVFKLGTATGAVGKTLILPGQGMVSIRGVVKDFYYLLLTERVQSFFFRYSMQDVAYANLKIASNDIFQTFTDMESSWKRLGTDAPFEARFFEDEIEDSYVGYFSMVKICSALGVLAISISCLGLLGMVVYATENRIKEVGVRKIMGASTVQLVVLLSKSYFRLLAVAIMIAVPITYLLFDKVFLRIQYYHIDIGVAEIVISIGLLLLLGLVTTLSQTWRAARANPADTVRHE
ncbi:ABC transporter permease [Fulvivirgaceae bacterium PWU5]|uniref:ABC transporter permease n=1 Tax=Dawidia cretensis TaxID=2782350 RepID=A0AAP2GWE9_9BACT|nr:ABC transporter permease [Dawidia cretensis]MBT1710517.1 ABC transporter permease [Dawidia cretensis]